MTRLGRIALGLALGAAMTALSPASPADDPPALAGSWAWKWTDAQGQEHRHVLELEGAGAQLSGRERADDGPAVKVDDLKADGPKVSFAVNRGGRYAVYQGKLIPPGTIDGEVTVMENGMSNKYGWTASRQPGKK